MSAILDDVAYVRALAEFQPRPIHNDLDNAHATGMLESIDALDHPSPEQLAVAEILATLIKAYEARYSLEPASGVAVLRELMLARGLRQKDLEATVGSKGMVSDILNERRSISKAVARKLATQFHVAHTLFL